MRNRFLNAVWWYHQNNCSEREDIVAVKKVFGLIEDGDLEAAAEAAEGNKAALAIWKKATMD